MTDLSIVIPALHEASNLRQLLPTLRATLASEVPHSEILVVTLADDLETASVAMGHGATVITQSRSGYAAALVAGLASASGEFVMTMDADLSHPTRFIPTLWRARHTAELIIGSRYVPGGRASMPAGRRLLSRSLNRVFSRGLGLPVRDMSSGFRLYCRHILSPGVYASRHFDILQEILVRAYADGWRVREVPFDYEPRDQGSSHARIVAFGFAYCRTFWSLWKLRNSILCADYDGRAYDSVIPLQRYWQRSRFRHLTELVADRGPVLDVGCGSSRVIGALPPGSVALDLLLNKLRYAKGYSRWLVQGSGFSLPFADGSFACVLCSQVIEHVPKDSGILEELNRVLAPGGRLVLGTPDYANWQWRWIEKAYGFAAPGGYADEHIAHYTRDELIAKYRRWGYSLEESRYIMRGELILAFAKPHAVPTWQPVIPSRDSRI
jgi:dolichol-phosphate mannosyltransferase